METLHDQTMNNLKNWMRQLKPLPPLHLKRNPNHEVPPRLGIPDLSGSGYISEASASLL